MRLIASTVMAALVAGSAAAADVQPTLSPRETAALAAVLKRADKGSITTACAGAWCHDLAAAVGNLFAGAGWTVRRVSHGGLGIDGVSGIRVNSCGVRAQGVRDAIRRATTRPVEAVSDGECAAGDREIYLVIGTPN